MTTDCSGRPEGPLERFHVLPRPSSTAPYPTGRQVQERQRPLAMAISALGKAAGSASRDVHEARKGRAVLPPGRGRGDQRAKRRRWRTTSTHRARLPVVTRLPPRSRLKSLTFLPANESHPTCHASAARRLHCRRSAGSCPRVSWMRWFAHRRGAGAEGYRPEVPAPYRDGHTLPAEETLTVPEGRRTTRQPDSFQGVIPSIRAPLRQH